MVIIESWVATININMESVNSGAGRIVYQDCGDFTLFDPEWKAREEVDLLEAVELYNYGNWGDIAGFIPNKSVDQIKQHFVDHYVRGCLGRVVWETVKNKGNTIHDHTSTEGCLSPTLVQPLPVINELAPTHQQQLGYMPNRDDFEREYDNEVESLVATLSMNVKEEDDLDRDMKLAYIDIYNRRLSERFRRKEIVRDYELIKQFYKSLQEEEENTVSATDNDNHRPDGSMHSEIVKTEYGSKIDISPSSKLTTSASKRNSNSTSKGSSPNVKCTTDKDAKLRETMKIFTQFLSRSQMDEVLYNLPRERDLISRTRELIRLRRSGFRKLSDVSRDKRKENKKYEGSTGNTGFGPKSMAHVAKLNEMDSVIGKNSLNKSSSSSKTASPIRINLKDSRTIISSAHSGRKEGKEHLRQGESKMTSGLDFNFTSSSKAKSAVHSASKLLSIREKKLCSSLNLTPRQYIQLKTLIIKEHLREVGKSKSALENVDKNVRRKLVNFIAQNGWIPSKRQ
ncbi:transcriptional adapter 2-beta-like [Brevipalpus obovatus]|uniref:transcriptional adapter 2-beta-like n=1 Tax=Brevipalpus obovatus TaxID=246614 RepID=UPI003D9F2EA8